MDIRFHSVAETQSFAEDLVKKIPLGKVVALKGDLGTGKTTFIEVMKEPAAEGEKVTELNFSKLSLNKKGNFST